MIKILTKVVNNRNVAYTKEHGEIKENDIILMTVKNKFIKSEYKILETPKTRENNDYKVLRLSTNTEAEVDPLWFNNSTRKSFLVQKGEVWTFQKLHGIYV